jgi:hypothetical protein
MRKARISSGPFFIVPQPRKKRIGVTGIAAIAIGVAVDVVT